MYYPNQPPCRKKTSTGIWFSKYRDYRTYKYLVQLIAPITTCKDETMWSQAVDYWQRSCVNTSANFGQHAKWRLWTQMCVGNFLLVGYFQIYLQQYFLHIAIKLSTNLWLCVLDLLPYVHVCLQMISKLFEVLTFELNFNCTWPWASG